ncbi:MAG: hypothetical protein ACO1TE_09575 [Prosthecobacter sp.]
MKTALLLRSHLFLGLLVPFLLSQCVLTNTDPGYLELEKTADRNPSPDAIVGMWHRVDSRKVLKDSTTSYLFKSDGTMHALNQTLLLGMGGSAPRQSNHYYYAGNGVWRLRNSNIQYRISHGKLLFHWAVPQTYELIRYVFERQ